MGKKSLVRDVEVVDAGVKGEMIGKKNGRVFLLSDVVPGDVVDILVTGKKKSLPAGIPVKFNHYSPNRTTPFCQHFEDCGGCRWQNIQYHTQLRLKEKQVFDAFNRIAEITPLQAFPIIPAAKTRYYRNKLDFSASSKRWFTRTEIDSGKDLQRDSALGFHVQGRFDKVLDIEKCYLQPDPSNQIRMAVKEFAVKNSVSFYDHLNKKGFLRSLIIRNSLEEDLMVILVVSEDDQDLISGFLNHLQQTFSEITSMWYVVNDKPNDSLHDLDFHHFSGNTYIRERAGHLQFKLGPASFYQTNSKQAETLYETAAKMAETEPGMHILDLYCGVGTIGMYMSKNCRKLTGLDIIPEAIDFARKNAMENNVKNATFYCGEAEKILNTSMFEDDRPEIVFTDPPRAGMHKNVIRFLQELAPAKIVYISCNPATQARDTGMLSNEYQVSAIQPVDMFPHTFHVENIAILTRK